MTPPEVIEGGSSAPERVPIFGTWSGIYSAVIVLALLVMAAIGLFSGWPY